MPPRIKKNKRNNVLPQLSFVESPTQSTIKFPNSGSSQTQPLEVPTVPYTEGNKWVALQFTQADSKNIRLPNRRRRKSKSELDGIDRSLRKRTVVSGREHRHHSSCRHGSSTTSYVPLEVTVSRSSTARKRHSRHSGEGHSDTVPNNFSSHPTASADEPRKAISLPNGNDTLTQSDKMADVPPIVFSVKTPIFESGFMEAMNCDETQWCRRTSLIENLEVNCQQNLGMDDLNEKTNSASPKCKDRRKLGLFQSSESEDYDLQEAEVLAPDTPEHERDLTFYQRRLRKTRAVMKEPRRKLSDHSNL